VLRSIGAVAGVTAVDVATARSLSRGDGVGRTTGGQEVAKAITIGRPAEEIYRLWRNFENLPRFMTHLDSVKTTGAKTSHWAVKTLGGIKVEWDAEITEDQPGKKIAWRSLPGADVQSSGTVEFRTATRDRGTEVLVTIQYTPPAGKLGVALASIFGEEPGQLTDHALRQLKQLIEVGEITRSDASIHRHPHPARPAGAGEQTTAARRVSTRSVDAATKPTAATESPTPSVQPLPEVPR
jgi:uncharacterized membrane protein